MSRQQRRLLGVSAAVAAVMLFGYVHRATTAPIELFWGALGAVAATYSSQVARRRWRLNGWRKAHGINGLFAIIAQGAAIQRTLGLAQGVLILVSGLAAMTTPASVRPDLQFNDHLTAAAVIGLGLCITFSAWYADRLANQAVDYQQLHPEE